MTQTPSKPIIDIESFYSQQEVDQRGTRKRPFIGMTTFYERPDLRNVLTKDMSWIGPKILEGKHCLFSTVVNS
jgi:lipopolysaccharide/colanic/teichoic acid biosynthesis glycosyltransferase